MQFTRESLESFKDSGKNICVYSKEISKFLLKYKPTDFYNFSSRLYYYWVNNQRPIPVSVVTRIMTENNVNNIEIGLFSVGSGNTISPPKNDIILFYFLGLLLGDGCLVHRKKGMNRNIYHAQISFSTKKDAEFGRLIAKHLFKINSSIYSGRGCYDLCIYSKPLVMILNKIYKIPIGEKYSKLCIPPVINSVSNKSIRYFLKGIFDSDGNIYDYRKGKSVQIRQKSQKFILEIWGLFNKVKLGFNMPYYDKANDSWLLWSSKRGLIDNFIKKIINLKVEAPVAQSG